MTGWNLPPGCNVSDLPGNRPEDARYEAQVEAICDALAKHGICLEFDQAEVYLQITDHKIDALIESILALLHDAWAEGYSEGAADEAQAREMREGEAE